MRLPSTKQLALRLLLASTMAAAAALAACGDDDDHEDSAADCKAIIDACHVKDPGTGPVHECHEGAEEEPATCAAKKTECIATCNAAPAK